MQRIGQRAVLGVAVVGLWFGATGCSTKLKQCTTDLAACKKTPTGQVARTGQTACYDTIGAAVACSGSGQDGELQKGLPRAYVDNGDGTVTDLNTGLMWEKKSDDGGIHDMDNAYTWADAFSGFIAALNSGAGFADHTDWRLPNIKELQSLGLSRPCFNPPVAPAFDTNCVPGCTVTTCSCAATAAGPFYFWSSTSYGPAPNEAWHAFFWCGPSTDHRPKTHAFAVPAVRGPWLLRSGRSTPAPGVRLTARHYFPLRP